MAEYTRQPSDKDNYLRSHVDFDDTNYGSLSYLEIHDDAADKRRPILEFDITDFPGSTINSATLKLYYYYHYEPLGNPVGETIWAYKLTRTDWVELESTWNIYKTGSSWTSPGGDYVTSNPSGDSAQIPAGFGWMEWDVKAIVEDAIASEGSIVEILLKDATELGADYMARWYSNNYGSNKPKLVIDYTPVIGVDTLAATNVQKTSATLNGEITNLDGGGNADERGFVYDTESHEDNPGDTAPADSDYYDAVEDYLVNETDSFGAGAFDLPLTGLAELTKYYVRAYAHNTLGYTYGDEVYFHTLESLTGWPYRGIVPIAGATGAGTNYSVPVEVYKGEGTNKAGVAYLNNHCTDYPNDIRLTDIDGETKLDHWKTPCEDISAYTVKSISGNAVDADGNIWAFSEGKIWKSPDGGDSWVEMYSVDYSYGALFIDSNGNFYGAGNGAGGIGIYRSTDQGENWTRAQALNANCHSLTAMSFTEITKSGAYQGYLLFGVYSTGVGSETEAMIYRSTNSGEDWSQVWPEGAPGAGQRHIHICQADPYHHGYVYATVGDTVESLKFMRSTDGGTNWTDIWTGTENGVRVHFTAMAFTENYRLLGEDYLNGWVCRTSDDSTLIKLWQPSSPGTGFVSFMMVVGDILYVGHRGEGPYSGGAYSTARIDRALGPGFEQPEYIYFCGDDNENAIWIRTDTHNPFPQKLGYLIYGDSAYKLIPGYQFWAEVADDLSSDRDICIYYGKTGASSESDIKSAFILADDFNDNELDTALWNSSGTISEETTRLKASAEGSTSYIISKNKVSGNFCATMRFSEFTCPSTNSGYAVLQAIVSAGNYANAWRIKAAALERLWGLIYKGGVLQDDGFEAVAPLAGEFKIVRVDGDDIRVYTRHESLGWDLRATADAMWSGDLDIILLAISAENNPAVSVYFDTLIVRKYVSPEPSVGTPGVEQVILPPILPPTATSTSEALAPTIEVGVTISAVTAEATSQALAPILPHVEIFATTAVATSEALAPTLPNATIIGVTATADSEALSPVIRISYTVVAEVAEATSEAIAPAVTAEKYIEVIAPTAESTSEALVPTIAAAVDIVAVTATADSAALAPTILAVQNVDITAVVATADGVALAPTITTTWNVDIVAPVATADSEAVAPAISAITNVDISAVVAQATSEALAPEITVEGDALVLAVTATADSQAIAPTIELLTEILAVTATADSLAIVPAIATTWSIEILAAVATADSQAYAVAILAQKNVTILALTALADSLALPSVYAGRDLIGLTFTRPVYDALSFTRKVWDAKTFTK